MHKVFLKTIFFASALFMLPLSAWAAPSILGVSGAVSNGQTINVAGNGFGTKSPVAPILWAPLDSSQNPSSLGRITSWSAMECFTYNSTNGYHGSNTGTITTSKNYPTCHDGAGSGSSPLVLEVNPYNSLGVQLNALGARFYTYRKRFPVDKGTNVKSIEFIGADYSTDISIIFNSSTDQWVTQNPSGAYFYTSGGELLNSWNTEELVAQVGASGGAPAATFDWWENGVLDGWMGKGGATISLNGGADVVTRADVAYHGDFTGPTITMKDDFFNDIYLDNTWARVMICSGSIWSNRGNCEIQIPTGTNTWNPTQLQIQVNQGAFSNSANAYLYVVDAAGAVNPNGYQITFNAGVPDTTPPSAPSGLSVQ